MGTNYKQIAAYKTQKTLIEFKDDTRYDTEAMAWPHLRTSRIRINMKDYSKGKGDNAVDVFYNLSPEEFIRLAESLNAVRQISSIDKRRWDITTARFKQTGELVQNMQLPQDQIDVLCDLAEQFKLSRNEAFAEAGEKLSAALEELLSQTKQAHEECQSYVAKALAEVQKESENALKVREVFTDIKILNFDAYINPDNPAERRVTSIRVAYAPYMSFPFIFEVGNGWAEPYITSNGGTMIKEGTTRMTATAQIFIQDKVLFPMLRRVELFVNTMTACAMQKYFDKVSDPVLTCYGEEPETKSIPIDDSVVIG